MLAPQGTCLIILQYIQYIQYMCHKIHYESVVFLQYFFFFLCVLVGVCVCVVRWIVLFSVNLQIFITFHIEHFRFFSRLFSEAIFLFIIIRRYGEIEGVFPLFNTNYWIICVRKWTNVCIFIVCNMQQTLRLVEVLRCYRKMMSPVPLPI